MKLIDLKIYGLNGLAMALNFSEIEIGLKILLTIVVMGYTIQKWYLMNKRKNEKD
jgi:cbb3-type cytochrome oxidase subunit 1